MNILNPHATFWHCGKIPSLLNKGAWLSYCMKFDYMHTSILYLGVVGRDRTSGDSSNRGKAGKLFSKRYSWETRLKRTFRGISLAQIKLESREISFVRDVHFSWPLRFGETLQWRHNEHDGVSIHQPHDCLLNCLFGRRSKKTSKLRVTGLCAGNSQGTGEFPAQKASNAENVSIWWRHHVWVGDGEHPILKSPQDLAGAGDLHSFDSLLIYLLLDLLISQNYFSLFDDKYTNGFALFMSIGFRFIYMWFIPPHCQGHVDGLV